MLIDARPRRLDEGRADESRSVVMAASRTIEGYQDMCGREGMGGCLGICGGSLSLWACVGDRAG